MTSLDYDGYQKLAKRLFDIINEKSADLGTYPFATPEEACDLTDCWEELYATTMDINGDRAILLHWGTSGDWTKALLIPEDNFYTDEDGYYGWVIEALQWFIRG